MVSRLEDDDVARSLVSAAASERWTLPNPEVALADTLVRLRNLRLEMRQGEVTRTLADPALADEERLALMQELQRLRELKRGPLQPLHPSDGDSQDHPENVGS